MGLHKIAILTGGGVGSFITEEADGLLKLPGELHDFNCELKDAPLQSRLKRCAGV